MSKAVIAGGIVAAVAVLFIAVIAGQRAIEKNAAAAPSEVAPAPPPGSTPPPAPAALEADAGFLYGRVTAADGATYEGRLRFGEEGDQEASWGDYFNGSKNKNHWVSFLPPEKVPKVSHAIEIFGLKFGSHEGELDLGRVFMARFGDIARIDAQGRDVRVTLKSGTVFVLNRMDASDFDDGLRVWDATRDVSVFDSMQVRSIELLAAGERRAAPSNRLYGTVHTRRGDFTGFIQWDREECVGTDELDGHIGQGSMTSLRFDTIRVIEHTSPGSASVTLTDGRELLLEGTNDVDRDNRGIYVDDPRYGRVLVSWDAFERVEFRPEGSGPAYGDFPPGVPLKGTVTTRDGRRLAGRLVYDLDESETTETFDAPSGGVDYTIPFGLVSSIAVPDGGDRAKVILQSGEELRLERSADLGEGNAGMLIFVEGGKSPEYVAWADIAKVDFERPPAMYPPG